jgi:hypothetical protein
LETFLSESKASEMQGSTTTLLLCPQGLSGAGQQAQTHSHPYLPRSPRAQSRPRFRIPHFDSLLFPRTPVQRQRRYKKEKYEHHAQLDEKHQDQSAELSFVDLKEMRHPEDACVPKQPRSNKIEQRERETDNKCSKEKVSEENNCLVFHAAHYFI